MANFPANDYAHHLGQARAVEWINSRLADPTKCKVDPETNCWIATKGLNETGYATGKKFTNDQIALQRVTGIPPPRNSEMNFLLHRVAFVAQNGRNPNVASHLCDPKACFNPAHIVDETQSQNLGRRFCLPSIICLEHQHVILQSPCVHVPRCIKKSPLGVQCCLSRQNLAPILSQSDAVMSDAITGSPPASGFLPLNLLSLSGSEELLLARQLKSDSEAAEPSSDYPSSPPFNPALISTASIGGLPDLQSSSPVRGPTRRRPGLLPVPPPAPDSSSEAIDTQAFVVPDGSQYIEYQTDSDSGSDF